jgi:hypothetical protein
VPVGGGQGPFSGATVWRQAFQQVAAPFPQSGQRPSAFQVQPTSRLWTPLDLGPKLLFWLPASALSGADSSSITTWADQSGNGNNATGNSTGGTLKPILRTSLGPSGGNAVRLSGGLTNGEYFDLPTTLLSGLSGVNGAALFGFYKQTTNPPASTNDAGPVFGDFGTDTLANHEPYVDNTIYDDGLADARKTTTLNSTSDWQLLEIRSKTNDWRMAINATADGSNSTTYYSTTTNTFAVSNAPKIGAASITGTGSPNYEINALLSELVGTSDFLTTAEKEKLQGYFLWTATRPDLLPVGHTYAAAPPTVSLTSGANSLSCATGAFTLSGQAAVLPVAMPASTGTFTLTGNALTPAVIMTASRGTFTLTGNAVTPAVTMPAGTGAFTLTGTAAALSHGYSITAARGSFTLTGNAVALEVGHVFTATTGTFTLTGRAMTTAVAMSATTGTFSLTGYAVTPAVAVPLSRGTFTLSGQAAALKAGRLLTAATGAFVLTGNAAAINKVGSSSLVADRGSFTLTGYAASTLHGARLSATTGVFALSGTSAAFRASRALSALTGAFTLAGNAVGLLHQATITAQRGVFSLTGRAAGISRGLTIQLGTGLFAFVGFDLGRKHPDVTTPAQRRASGTPDDRSAEGSVDSRAASGSLTERSASGEPPAGRSAIPNLQSRKAAA